MIFRIMENLRLWFALSDNLNLNQFKSSKSVSKYLSLMTSVLYISRISPVVLIMRRGSNAFSSFCRWAGVEHHSQPEFWWSQFLCASRKWSLRATVTVGRTRQMVLPASNRFWCPVQSCIRGQWSKSFHCSTKRSIETLEDLGRIFMNPPKILEESLNFDNPMNWCKHLFVFHPGEVKRTGRLFVIFGVIGYDYSRFGIEWPLHHFALYGIFK